jgi:hypothetical protein
MLELTREANIKTNWVSLIAVIFAVSSITLHYSSLKSNINELKDHKADKDSVQTYFRIERGNIENFERMIIDLTKLTMKIADRNKVEYDKDYFESRIKKFNNK